MSLKRLKGIEQLDATPAEMMSALLSAYHEIDRLQAALAHESDMGSQAAVMCEKFKQELSTLKAEAPIERPKLEDERCNHSLPLTTCSVCLVLRVLTLESYATAKEAEVRKLEAQLKDALQDAEDGDTVIESLNRIFADQRDCQDCQALEKLKAENAELKLSTPPHNNGDAVQALEEILPRFLEACEDLARGMGEVKPESKAGTFMHNLNYVQLHFKALRASKQAGS